MSVVGVILYPAKAFKECLTLLCFSGTLVLVGITYDVSNPDLDVQT